MGAGKHILAICGSTRNRSANRDLIDAIARLAKDRFTVTVYDGLSTLPYFNQDVTDADTPLEVMAFRNAIVLSDAVLICTPEYVFSLPGILKNALEWTVSTTVFSDKPAALITASSSGEKAHESLLLIMKTLGVKTTDELCLWIPGIKSKLHASGEITDAVLAERLGNLIAGLDSI